MDLDGGAEMYVIETSGLVLEHVVKLGVTPPTENKVYRSSSTNSSKSIWDKNNSSFLSGPLFVRLLQQTTKAALQKQRLMFAVKCLSPNNTFHPTKAPTPTQPQATLIPALGIHSAEPPERSGALHGHSGCHA